MGKLTVIEGLVVLYNYAIVILVPAVGMVGQLKVDVPAELIAITVESPGCVNGIVVSTPPVSTVYPGLFFRLYQLILPFVSITVDPSHWYSPVALILPSTVVSPADSVPTVEGPASKVPTVANPDDVMVVTFEIALAYYITVTPPTW